MVYYGPTPSSGIRAERSRRDLAEQSGTRSAPGFGMRVGVGMPTCSSTKPPTAFACDLTAANSPLMISSSYAFVAGVEAADPLPAPAGAAGAGGAGGAMIVVGDRAEDPVDDG